MSLGGNPNLFINRVEGSRRRHRDLAQGLGAASEGALSAVDRLRQLIESKEQTAFERAQAKDERDYQRGRDVKADARADAADARAGAEAKRINRVSELNEFVTRSNLTMSQQRAEQERAAAQREREQQDLAAARELMSRHVRAGIANKQSAQDIARAAHDNVNLAAITGDEEVEAEYARQVAEAQKAAQVAQPGKGGRPGKAGGSRRPQPGPTTTTQHEAPVDEGEERIPLHKGGGIGTAIHNRGVKLRSAFKSLKSAKDAFTAYDGSTWAPATGPIAGPVRTFMSDMPGFPGFDVLPEKERQRARSAAAALNAQVFAINRMDAPTGTETMKIEPLEVEDTDTPEQLAAKFEELERQIADAMTDLKGNADAQGFDTRGLSFDDPPPAVAPTTQGPNPGGAAVLRPGANSGASDFVVVSDGKETLRIPRRRLAEAQAEGFEVLE